MRHPPRCRMIQAIETSYKGCRFRSRLEARWAVFFDALDIPWEYEPQGWEMDGGARYLPDFWLPEQRDWVEVKGATPTGKELGKISAFSRELDHRDKRLKLFVGGIPEPDADYVGQHEKLWHWEASVKMSTARLADPSTWRLGIDELTNLGPAPQSTAQLTRPWTWWRTPGGRWRRETWLQCKRGHLFSAVPCLSCHMCADAGDWFHDNRTTQRIRDAYSAARSARFEHGESGPARP